MDLLSEGCQFLFVLIKALYHVYFLFVLKRQCLEVNYAKARRNKKCLVIKRKNQDVTVQPVLVSAMPKAIGLFHLPAEISSACVLAYANSLTDIHALNINGH